MFEKYLEYGHIPAGAILDRIRRVESLSQREVARRAGISPQRVNNYIHNRRRISPLVAVRLSEALRLSDKTYFVKAQGNHDRFIIEKSCRSMRTPDLSKFRKIVFWDTRFETIDWEKGMPWIIQRVFEYGCRSEIEETIRFYGVDRTKKILSGIKSEWHRSDREANIQKYLKHVSDCRWH